MKSLIIAREKEKAELERLVNEPTAAAAGTIFMRLTESWKKAHGSTKWDGR